jgi:hypothetical protein
MALPFDFRLTVQCFEFVRNPVVSVEYGFRGKLTPPQEDSILRELMPAVTARVDQMVRLWLLGQLQQEPEYSLSDCCPECDQYSECQAFRLPNLELRIQGECGHCWISSDGRSFQKAQE